MKWTTTAVIVTGLLCSALTGVQAAEKTAQQQKMTVCNQQAGTQNLKGDARKSFMSQCLKKQSAPAVKATQQMKMKTCNAEAGSRKLGGDERKAFMSQCLKKAS